MSDNQINAVEADPTRHELVRSENGEIVRAEGHIVVFDNIDKNMYCVLENERNLRLFGLIPTALQFDTVPETSMSSSETLGSLSDNTACLTLEAGCSNQATSKEKVKWTKNAVLALITSWKANQPNFASTTVKNDAVWNMIAQDIKKTGLIVTATQTENKWKNIRKAYMAVKDHNSKSGNAPKTCKFYDELDEIFSKSPSVAPVALASSRRKRSASTTIGNDFSSDDETSEEMEADRHSEKKSKKAKKSKLNRELEAWSKTLREDAEKRELTKEKRHEAVIAVQNKGIAAFTDVMNKLLEKL
ncbi:trihelix transcription factor GT-2-like [Temnothorax curvispinosus]|uniref:Trihelix transcription factor GT-2-like n=1 Tax=Temnothorax curvispinosus TaxID=300111 RepID=A0A6J1PHS4_9HYME|nr:trihelix transcription factor GT-2-like [Temnothorax curvispinosus]